MRLFQNLIIAAMLAGSTISAQAAIDCDSVSPSNEHYIESMEALATQARLPDNYFTRYHEDVVSDMCKGDEESINSAIDYGYVKRSEVESIRESLGLDKRSDIGVSYEYSRQKFSGLGLSSAASGNIADFYTKKPHSQCGRLAKRALEGNPRAITELQSSPNYCVWDYSENNADYDDVVLVDDPAY